MASSISLDSLGGSLSLSPEDPPSLLSRLLRLLLRLFPELLDDDIRLLADLERLRSLFFLDFFFFLFFFSFDLTLLLELTDERPPEDELLLL